MLVTIPRSLKQSSSVIIQKMFTFVSKVRRIAALRSLYEVKEFAVARIDWKLTPKQVKNSMQMIDQRTGYRVNQEGDTSLQTIVVNRELQTPLSISPRVYEKLSPVNASGPLMTKGYSTGSVRALMISNTIFLKVDL